MVKRSIIPFSLKVFRPINSTLMIALLLSSQVSAEEIFVKDVFGQVQNKQEKVTGTVSSSSSGALAGVTVSVKGKSVSTYTDQTGKFSISANPGDVLVFKFVGFKTAESTVSGNTLDMVLDASEDESIDEVIVTGYTAKKKSEILAQYLMFLQQS